MTLTQNTCVFLFFSNLPRPPPPRSLMSYIEKRVIQCSPYGLSADVYSFGICMWEVFQGTKCDFLSAAEICNRKKSIRPSIPISYFDDDDNNDNDDVVNQTQGLDSAASTNDANIKRNTTVANTTKTAAAVAAARSCSSKNKNKKKYIGIGMPKQLQNLMQQCWNDNSNERPTFNEISSQLNLILLELFYYHYNNNSNQNQKQQQQQSSSSPSRRSPSSSSYVPASTAHQKSNNEEDEDHVGRSAAKSIAASNSAYNSDKSNNRNYTTATSSSRRRIKNTKLLPRGGGGGVGQGGEAAASAFWYRLEMIHSSGLLDD